MPTQKSDLVRIIPAGAPTELGENHFINCFPESVENTLTQIKRAYCVKRKGLTQTVISNTSVSGEPRGVFYWSAATYTFMVYGDTVYAYSSGSSSTPEYTITLTTSTGLVGFTEAVYGDVRKLFFCDGSKGYVIESTTPTSYITIDGTSVGGYTISNAGTGYAEGTYSLGVSGGDGSGFTGTYTVSSAGEVTSITITDPGTGYTVVPTISFPSGGGSSAAATLYLSSFPTPHIPTPVFLDGMIFLAKTDTTKVYNSAIGDYNTWQPEGYIETFQFSGNVTAIAKQQNYILALKTDSVEYLYNAGNAAPDSPLSRTTQAATNIGCTQTSSVVTIEDATLFVGVSAAGGYLVYKIENFKEEKLSTEYIDYVLNEEYGLYSTTSVGNNYISGSVIRVDGHRFYVINLVSSGSERALVYDIDEKFWSFWDSTSAGSSRFIGVRASTKNGVPIYQVDVSSTTGKVLSFPTTSTQGDYNDNGVVYYMYYNTPVIDMDNRFRKRFNRIEVVGNRYSYSNTVSLDYSDSCVEAIDKLSNSSWQINMQAGNYQAYLTNLGSSRSRIWQVGHSTDAPLRFESIELHYLQGEH